MKSLLGILFIVGVCVSGPTLAFAQPSFTGSIVPCGGSCITEDGLRGIQECSTCDLVALIQRIINFLIFAGVVIATLLFVYAGFLMVTSGGSESQISNAKGIFLNVAIGLVLVLAAWLIDNIIMNVMYKGESDNPGSWAPWNQIICNTNTGGQGQCRAIERPELKEGDALPPGAAGTGEYCFTYNKPNILQSGSTQTELCYSSQAECTNAQSGTAAGTSPTNCGFKATSPATSGGALPPIQDSLAGPNQQIFHDVIVNELEILPVDSLLQCAQNRTGVGSQLCITSTTGASGVKSECLQASGCTTLNNLRGSVVDELNHMRRDCNDCLVLITGATESGGDDDPHATSDHSHANGYKVDIQKGNLATDDYFRATYMNTNIATVEQTSAGTRYTTTREDGTVVRVIDEPPKTQGGSGHFDLQVIPPKEN